MSEVVVVLCVSVASLMWVSRRALVLRQSAGDSRELERLLAAVRRACADFAWQAARRLLVLLLVLAALLGLALKLGHAGTIADRAVWLWLATGAGGVTALAVAQVAQWAAARATAHGLAGLRVDLDHAASATFGGAALAAAFADCASLLVSVAGVGGYYLYLIRDTAVSQIQALQDALGCLPAVALGAVAGAAVFQAGGSSFQTAARVAASAVRSRQARIMRDEDRNPALVAELVGNTLGGVVCRSTDVFSALVLVNCVLGLVAGAVSAHGSSPATLAVLGLPVMVRAASAFATLITFGAFRLEGQLMLPSIFAAARGGHALIACTGLFGASLWLIAEPFWLSFAAAGALGVFSSVVSAGWLFAKGRKLMQAGAAADREQTSVARALGLGLQQTWPPLLMVGVCLGSAHVLGSRTGLPQAGLLALLLAVTAMLGSASFSLGESLFFNIGESVALISKLGRGSFDSAARGRAEELGRAGSLIGNLGQTQAILGALAVALLGALCLPLLPAQGSPEAARMGHPIVLLGGILGAASVLYHVGRSLETSSRAASVLDADLLERHTDPGTDADALEAEGVEAEGRVQLPSYRMSVDLAARAAAEPLLSLGLGVLAAPLCIGIALRAAYGPDGAGVISVALTALGALAALTGGATALAAQGTLAALSLQPSRNDARTERLAGSHPARDFVGHCVGPAALLGLKATVISSLAAAPLLF